MGIPAKVKNGGNASANCNVFRVVFSQSLSSAPTYQMWDNSSTYPAVDASGSTTTKEAFAGTANNSNKPEYALVDTTNAAPSSSWLPASATGGSANPNRMKGATNYVTCPVIPVIQSAPGSFTVADSGSGSSLTAGVYKYTVTFVFGTSSGAPRGETTVSAEQTVTCVSGHSISISSIPTGPTGCVARKIYRTQSGGATGTEKLVTTLNDNTTTTYTDNNSDASITGNAAQPTSDTTCSITFNISAEFGADSAVPSSSSQNILLQIGYQYTGSAPSLTYYYNDSGTGTEAAPNWTTFTPGTHGIRLVNTGTSAGTYKWTLPSSGVQSVGGSTGELWVTA